MTDNYRIKMDGVLENVGDMSLKRRAKEIVEGLSLKEEDDIVDIGCGDGFFLHLLGTISPKFHLTGFDHDQIVLKNAKKNLISRKVELIEGDVTGMPFKSNQFEKAIMTEVLEHVEDDKKALAEVYRILKKKGLFILTVPSIKFPFLWDPVNWVLQKFGTHISGTGFFAGIWARHLRLYKKAQLERLIKNAGFEIEEVKELTTRCLPFNHHLVNLVARFLYDVKPSPKLSDPLSKFKNAKKPFLIRTAFFTVNLFDKLNDLFHGKHGLNIYIKARKV